LKTVFSIIIAIIIVQLIKYFSSISPTFASISYLFYILTIIALIVYFIVSLIRFNVLMSKENKNKKDDL
jgi:multisubunit Na+/H+ antiporter MnhE subunit